MSSFVVLRTDASSSTTEIITEVMAYVAVMIPSYRPRQCLSTEIKSIGRRFIFSIGKMNASRTLVYERVRVHTSTRSVGFPHNHSWRSTCLFHKEDEKCCGLRRTRVATVHVYIRWGFVKDFASMNRPRLDRK